MKESLTKLIINSRAMLDKPNNSDFIEQIVDLLQQARNHVINTVHKTMVGIYYEVGKMIVEEEQQGRSRAEYGKNLLKNLSKVLTKEFGQGFSVTNIQHMRKFYLAYKVLFETDQETTFTLSEKKLLQPSFNLSWSHYLSLIRIENLKERRFYEIESIKNQWNIEELQRQINSSLYTRLVLSRDKDEVLSLSREGLIIKSPKDAIKDPYVLEFLGLPEKSSYSESELEGELIDKLEHFLLELGNGFTFVARQKRISFDDKHFRIDLVFYNRILRCFVLIDLKIGELKHQDIGQMQMYVNYYDRKLKLEEENRTIGLILCQNKSEAVVEYTLPEDNEQIFASRYKTVLPTEEELKILIDQRK